jgi:anti-sigma regulatory factor (Ser/Thr protein kinase)
VSAARHALSDELAAEGVVAPMRDDAVLVLSELVSNAIRHADPLPNGDIRVTWLLDTDRLHLEITDGGALTRPQAAVAAMSSLGGRGLDIVRTICSAWGVTQEGNAVTVWADLPRKVTA